MTDAGSTVTDAQRLWSLGGNETSVRSRLAAKAARVKSEAYSLATSGKSLSRRESEAATRIQAVARGMLARRDYNELMRDDFSYLGAFCACSLRGKPQKRACLRTSDSIACSPRNLQSFCSMLLA